MNELRLTIPGEIRSKKNSKQIIRCGKRRLVIPSEAYKEWETMARYDALCQIDWQAFPVNVPCEVTALIYYKGQRPDLSGALESIGDCLEGILWENDKLIESWDGSRLAKDNANPRVEILMRWLNEG